MVTLSYFSVNNSTNDAQNRCNNKCSSLGQVPGGKYRSVKAINIVLERKLMEHSIHMIGGGDGGTGHGTSAAPR